VFEGVYYDGVIHSFFGVGIILQENLVIKSILVFALFRVFIESDFIICVFV
jgi:hypothetical protein